MKSSARFRAPAAQHVRCANVSTPLMNVETRCAALQDSSNILEDDKMRDHVFGNSPTTDKAILTSPLQQVHSISSETGLQFDPLDRMISDCSFTHAHVLNLTGLTHFYYRIRKQPVENSLSKLKLVL